MLDGYEEIGDNRNWLIGYEIGAGQGPLGWSGLNLGTGDPYGITIVTHGGTVYEGCWWQSPTNDYLCDFRARKQIVLRTSGSAYSYVLRKLWNWTLYTGNAAGCAGGIAGLWTGQRVTLPLLSDCVDGPMSSSAAAATVAIEEGPTIEEFRPGEILEVTTENSP